MLLITRRTGEGIVINDNIEIKILDIRGGRVKLGLEYPQGNTVYREEVFSKIQEENRAAAEALRPLAGEPSKIGTVLASLKKANPKGAKTDDTTNPGPDSGPEDHS